MLQEPDDALAKVKRDVVVDEVASQQSLGRSRGNRRRANKAGVTTETGNKSNHHLESKGPGVFAHLACFLGIYF